MTAAAARTGILIADDHAVVRAGIRLLLDGTPDLAVIAEAADGHEAVRFGMASDVELAILDVALPRLTGLQAARELHRRRPGPGLRTLLLSMYDKEQYFYEAAAAGASGYVLKRAADTDIVDACRAVIRGADFVLPTSVPDRVRARVLRIKAGDAVRTDPLTAREREIVKLVAEGHSSQEIADLLVISVKTVERHRSNVLEKLGIRDRVALTRFAIRQGLVEP